MPAAETGPIDRILPGYAGIRDGARVMRRIDELHLAHPFAGSRMLRDLLRQEGQAIGRRPVATVMRRMGVEALYRKPRLSHRHPAHTIYPYRLRELTISRPNHVRVADITSIPMARGFVYLFAVLDWASRLVLAWRLSNTLDCRFCVEAFEEAIAQVRAAGHLQYGSRVTVYVTNLHPGVKRHRGRAEYGWEGAIG